MKRILINATQTEELRVAMVDGQRLYDLDIEVPSREQKKSNIYKGKITRIEPSLEAAFVNYGSERHGFLPFKEIAKQYLGDAARGDNGKLAVKDALKVDQEIIVQVEKEERGNKGAALTSFISLAGRFLVAMPQNPRAGGVSRRIEGEDRDELKRVLSGLKMPDGMGVIVRTAGVGRSLEEMQWDLDYLTQVWRAIESAADEQKAPFLIYQESDIVIRALRDHYRADVGEILIDSKQAYQQAHDFMSMVMPGSINKLKLFEDKLPLFNRFQIENQIESAFAREVTLPSGGAIVIDHTEALTSIDVNSARATRGADIEDTAKMTNLEAADEIARQLRIRDLGGLIVIDFIDMLQNKNQREVENRLRNAVYDDRARVQIGRISRFGLLEMSRQRLRPSLEESSQIVCPRCSGQGTIRDIESLSLAVLRLLEDEALKDNTGKILARIPVECATYLLNEKREKVDALEQRREVHIVVIPDPKLETPHYHIERVKDNDTHRHESNYKKSYEMTTEETPVDLVGLASSNPVKPETAAVQGITPSGPRPVEQVAEQPAKPGLFPRLFKALFGSGETPAESEEKSASKSDTRKSRGGGNRSRRGRGRSGQKGRQKSANATAQKADTRSSDTDKDKAAAQEKSRESQGRSGRSRGGRSGNRGNRGGRQQDRNMADKTAASDSAETTAAADSEASTSEKTRKQTSRRKSASRGGSGRKSAKSDNDAAREKDQKEAAPVKDKAGSQATRDPEKPAAGTTPEAPTGDRGNEQSASPQGGSPTAEKAKKRSSGNGKSTSAEARSKPDKQAQTPASNESGPAATSNKDSSAPATVAEQD